MSSIVVPESAKRTIEAEKRAERMLLLRKNVKEVECCRTSELIGFLAALEEANGVLIVV